MKLFANLKDSDLQRAKKIIERHFGRDAGDFVIEELDGGASTRKYYRIYLPRVFCHRDYHSRNLMLWNERLYIIDFQDARMGPHLYDIVSLLGDSYVDLGPELRSCLLHYYAERHPDWKNKDLRTVQEQYSLVALQRHLKHLGTFGYLHENGDDSCLQFVRRTFDYLEGNLQKFDEALEAAEILSELFTISREKLAEMDL